MYRIYIMPTIGGGMPTNPRRPAYLTGGALYYGAENICIAATNVSQAEHDAIVLNADVLSAPEDIDTNPGTGAVNVIKTFLEDINIPAQWVNTSLTYREIIRKIGHLFYFAGRYSAISGREKLIRTGVAFNTQWSDLPAQAKMDIMATADDLGIDYSSIQATDTTKDILKFLADFWGQTPITIHGVDI